jgi:glycosyltransferase involved in cell wall biosynthesis
MLTAVLATLAGRRRGLVASKHNDEQVLKRLPVGLVHGALGRLPRRTIVLSDHVGRFVAEHGRLPAERLTRIYYGLEPAPFEPPPDLTAEQRARDRADAREEFGFEPDDVVFVCVARFAAQKAHDVLLRAFAAAAAATPAGAPPLRLLLVGGDPFGDGVERAQRLAAELRLGASVCFAGIRRDVPRLYALSDVYVMSSLWEGLGLVFLEAMAAGLPVLSTRVSAIPEVVDEDVTGLLVPPGESAPLAAAMGRLAGDPALRARLGAAGRERVRTRFALGRMVDQTLDVYRGLLGAGAEGV